jgi:hypothetical protein
MAFGDSAHYASSMFAWLLHRRIKDKDANPQERALWGDLISLGMVFPICIVTGFFLGRWIGGFFGHEYAGKLVGMAWGIAAAFWELYKTAINLSRFDPPPPPEGPNSGGAPGDE